MILGICDRLFWFGCHVLSGTEDLFVLHCIISHFWTNFIQLWCSQRIQYFERRLFIHVYSLFCFGYFFCSYFVYMEKVEDIVCKREINYFGGLPLEYVLVLVKMNVKHVGSCWWFYWVVLILFRYFKTRIMCSTHYFLRFKGV